MMKKAENLRSLTGNLIKTRGRTLIEFLGSFIELTVVDTLTHDLLIGDDALRELGAIIDYTRERVLLKGEWEFPHTPIAQRDLQIATTTLEEWIKMKPNLFAKKGTPHGRMPKTKFKIDTGDHPPIKQRPYRLPLTKRKIVEEEIQKMLDQGVIRPSNSPYSAPITLVPKPDSSWRFCSDYRQLNAITKKDAHPLPLIQDIFDSLAGAKIFSTLDLASGYWQIPMDEDSIEKTSFVCHMGSFEYLRLPFGLTNAPAVFQRTMNEVLQGMIGKFAMVYIDDIVVYSKSEKEHQEHLKLVFDALEQNGLKLKPSKCRINVEKVKLLGYIVSADGITCDPEKTKAIAELGQPQTVKEVRSFLGMAGYYRQCIRDFAKIAAPLVALTKKNARFIWNEERQRSFDRLKQMLISSEVMAHPDTSKPYKLYTDSLDYACGAILVQLDNNGVERPIQYISKQYSDSQRLMSTIEKEGFSIVHALTKLRPYLHGAKFTIYTDHKPLKALFLSEVKNTKIQRWASLIAEYGAPIEYRKGTNNIRADMLSRIRKDVEIAAMEETTEWIAADDLGQDHPNQIPWEFDQLDKEALSAEQKEMKEYQRAFDDDSDYELHEGLLYTTLAPEGKLPYPRLVLPPSARFRVIRRAHTEVGHQSVRKTLDRLQEAYKWPRQRQDVSKVIHNCTRCAVNQDRREFPRPLEMPIAAYPGQIIGMDLCGPFPPSKSGNRYLLVVIDHCSCWVEVKPIPTKESEHVLRYLEQEYLPRFGTPEVLITDQGTEFNAAPLRGYLAELGVEHRRTTPYQPSTNGKCKRANRTIKNMLRKLTNNKACSWEEHLGPALWAYRISTSTVTGYTPFFLQYGRKPRAPLTRMLGRTDGADPRSFGQRLDALAEAFQDAARATEDSRKYNRTRLQKRATAGPLQPGDHVIMTSQERAPLDSKWDHVFIVTKVRGPVISIYNQEKNKYRTVNRNKLRLVEPDLVWDDVNHRVTRTERRRLYIPPPKPSTSSVDDQRQEEKEPPTEIQPLRALKRSRVEEIQGFNRDYVPPLRRSKRIQERENYFNLKRLADTEEDEPSIKKWSSDISLASSHH